MGLPLPVVGVLLVILGLPELVDVTLYPCLHLCLASPWALSFPRPVSSLGTPVMGSIPNKVLWTRTSTYGFYQTKVGVGRASL